MGRVQYWIEDRCLSTTGGTYSTMTFHAMFYTVDSCRVLVDVCPK